MVDEATVDKLVERLTNRMNKANTEMLKEIGKKIGEIRELTPTQAQKLIQILKYGGSYDEILMRLSEETDLNIDEINKIFESYAKKDQMFYEQFYDYKDVPYVKYKDNLPLQRQTMVLASMARNEMYNFTRNNVLGYTIRDENGVLKFKGLRETYNDLMDTALLNVSQGKETFDTAMSSMLSDIGESGLKTLNYESGRAVRLDSAMNMHLRSKLLELHNENQKIYGKDFDYDGYEISVHSIPAPDHAEIQGRQFSIKEYDKLQAGDVAKTYKGKEVQIGHSKKGGYRPISEYNCYHKVFPIVLGVSDPEYSDKELQEMEDESNEIITYEGKEYTRYEATQVQRTLERKVREQKDIQILARESNNQSLLLKSQTKITQLTNKYREFSYQAGLPVKMDRMKVSGYKRVNVKEEKLRLYHGSPYNFEKFDMEMSKKNNQYVNTEEGHYFTKNKDFASDYGKYLYEVEIPQNKTIRAGGFWSEDEKEYYVSKSDKDIKIIHKYEVDNSIKTYDLGEEIEDKRKRLDKLIQLREEWKNENRQDIDFNLMNEDEKNRRIELKELESRYEELNKKKYKKIF